jgi:hypothetical protein
MNKSKDRSDENEDLYDTMRFDIVLYHIEPLLKNKEVTKQQIAASIRKGILDGIEKSLGIGLDGVPLPAPPHSVEMIDSKMLHRETVYVSLD